MRSPGWAASAPPSPSPIQRHVRRPPRRRRSTAVRAAVGWVGANQADDGAFLYRYDRDADAVLPGYSTVRHAGTLLALEQARGAGIDEAGVVADRGLDWAERQLTRLDGGREALTGDTGATALLALALIERRRVEGSTADDDRLRRLGRFLEGAVTDDGAVVAAWHIGEDRPVAGSRSPFFTGEVLWALAALHAELPAEGWDEPARRISRYLVTQRDDTERRFPPVSDHWGSYALAEMAGWPDPPQDGVLSADELGYARRQAGLFGVQARFESQRRPEGVVRLTRGPVALPPASVRSARGWAVCGASPTSTRTSTSIVRRWAAAWPASRACSSSARPTATTPGSTATWFRLGVTQIDDQQHAISALLAALPALEPRS